MPRAPDLDQLRTEIDRIDRSIVALLGERLRIVRAIAGVKQADSMTGLALRPGREAMMIRRLVAGESAGFPKSTLVRMWREMLAATTRLQTPYTVVAWLPPDHTALAEIARDHFGSVTPMHRMASAADALGAVAANGSAVAVLPLPTDADGWWALLLEPALAGLKVVARLPFAPLPNYPDDAGGLVVAPLAPEPTDDDLTLLLLESAPALRADLVEEGLEGSGLRRLASASAADGATRRHLLEADGCGQPADLGVGEALAAFGQQVLRAVPIGCYARPLLAGDLA